MKRLLSPHVMCPAMWGLGILTFWIRRSLYATAVDWTGLLTAGHPLQPVLVLISLAALALALLGCCGQEAAREDTGMFAAGLMPFAGYTAAAAGILTTMLLNGSSLTGRIGLVWKLLGYSTPVCLLLAGFARYREKPVHFLMHAAACVFLSLQMVDHYQLWCSNPQLQDYVFTLLATVAMIFFSYHLTALDVGCGKRKHLVFWGLLAQFLCLAELAVSDALYLYGGCFFWAAAVLLSLRTTGKGDV